MRIEWRRKGYIAIVTKVGDTFEGVVSWDGGEAKFKGNNIAQLERNMDAALKQKVDKFIEEAELR